MLKLLAVGAVLAFLFSAASPDDDEIQPEFFISSRTSAQSSVSKSRSRVRSSVAERRTHQATSRVASSFPLRHFQPHTIISCQRWLNCTSLSIAPAGTRAPPRSI
jgi:hypothetical protein